MPKRTFGRGSRQVFFRPRGLQKVIKGVGMYSIGKAVRMGSSTPRTPSRLRPIRVLTPNTQNTPASGSKVANSSGSSSKSGSSSVSPIDIDTPVGHINLKPEGKLKTLLKKVKPYQAGISVLLSVLTGAGSAFIYELVRDKLERDKE